MLIYDERVIGLVEGIEKVASNLESNGLLKEAEELDVVANTIEVLAGKIPAGDDRPAAIFPDSSSKVKDKKDHFPIPDAAHARNALARVNQYSDVPSWYDGTLEELKGKVRSAVKSKFPSIEISD